MAACRLYSSINLPQNVRYVTENVASQRSFMMAAYLVVYSWHITPLHCWLAATRLAACGVHIVQDRSAQVLFSLRYATTNTNISNARLTNYCPRINTPLLLFRPNIWLQLPYILGYPNWTHFRTDFTDLNLYCIKGALALVVLVSFSGYVC